MQLFTLLGVSIRYKSRPRNYYGISRNDFWKEKEAVQSIMSHYQRTAGKGLWLLINDFTSSEI